MKNIPDIYLPDGLVSINVCTYVHGSGMNVRLFGVPGADPERFIDWLKHEDAWCEHAQPSLWYFMGWFPKKPGILFVHVTANPHEAARIMENPGMLRLHAEEHPLVPLDPHTNDGWDSIVEFNNFIRAEIGEGERLDFSALSNISYDGVEDMLREAAEHSSKNNKKEDDT